VSLFLTPFPQPAVLCVAWGDALRCALAASRPAEALGWEASLAGRRGRQPHGVSRSPGHGHCPESIPGRRLAPGRAVHWVLGRTMARPCCLLKALHFRTDLAFQSQNHGIIKVGKDL